LQKKSQKTPEKGEKIQIFLPCDALVLDLPRRSHDWHFESFAVPSGTLTKSGSPLMARTTGAKRSYSTQLMSHHFLI
jgi:hypothetical protein